MKDWQEFGAWCKQCMLKGLVFFADFERVNWANLGALCFTIAGMSFDVGSRSDPRLEWSQICCPSRMLTAQ